MAQEHKIAPTIREGFPPFSAPSGAHLSLLTLIITLSALLWDAALHAEITRVREKLQEAETSDEKRTSNDHARK